MLLLDIFFQKKKNYILHTYYEKILVYLLVASLFSTGFDGYLKNVASKAAPTFTLT